MGDYWLADDTRPIHEKEAEAILKALQSLGKSLLDSRVDVLTDSMAVIGAWNSQGSKCPALNCIMKDIFQLVAGQNVDLHLSFVPSELNKADGPSRILNTADTMLSNASWINSDIDLEKIEGRMDELDKRITCSSGHKRKKSFQGSFLQFLQDLDCKHLSVCTPDDIRRFLIWKDFSGKTTIHGVHCKHLGQKKRGSDRASDLSLVVAQEVKVLNDNSGLVFQHTFGKTLRDNVNIKFDVFISSVNGHSRRDCESFKQDQENQGYSKHGPEIIEGRQETKLDAHSDTHSVCDNDTFSESGKNDTTDTLNVLIGAFNCANFENFTQILDIAVQKTDNFKVDKVAICLGTNDISKHKDDSDQINLLVTKAVAQVKSAYPESHVGLCSIIPRKGNSAQINRLNLSATSVNKFIRKLCAREDNVDYVDLEKLFYKNGTIIRSMFDKADNSGVHINTEGAQNINRKRFLSFSKTVRTGTTHTNGPKT
ncbi:unnamed protein product [Mytilus edulis]|uniref:Uncharacterized protein n=1 Tax=Mytilus edulis TaxID=6550 RepID=A0A8S3SU09_MYTED|nr:unnamed protein product [Mytilus edulis]